MADPVAAFVDAACVPRDGKGHNSGTLDEAGASAAGVDLPCGYDEVDALLLPHDAG